MNWGSFLQVQRRGRCVPLRDGDFEPHRSSPCWTSSLCFLLSRYPALLWLPRSSIHGVFSAVYFGYVVAFVLLHMTLRRRMATVVCSTDASSPATQLLSNTKSFSSQGTTRTSSCKGSGQTLVKCTGTVVISRLVLRGSVCPTSAQGGERAPTQEPVQGTDPRNGIKSFR